MTTYNPNNVFAKILRGEIPCKKVFESAHALAFHDIAPHAPMHVLVIPKGAYVNFSDFASRASAEEQADYVAAIGKVAQVIGADDAGYRLISNCGTNAHQEVPHLHVHILGGRPLGPMLARKD